MENERNQTMELTALSTYYVAFIIEDKSVMCATIFTGEYVDINDERLWILENKNNGNEYTFTDAQLKECLPLNDATARGTVDSHTI